MSRSLLLAPLFTLLSGCAYYEGPPDVTLEGAMDGTLTDEKAPLVLGFSKAPDPKTIKIEIARYLTDVEGNLPDEQQPKKMLDVFFSTDPDDGDSGGLATLSQDGSTLTIKPSAALPVGAELVILIEAGLSDTAGHKTTVRRKIKFAYKFALDCNKPTKVFTSGTYFLLADVTKPVPVQVKLLAPIVIDPATGQFIGQFTAGVRNPDQSRCKTVKCAATEACRTLPMEACVAPSERAGTVDEFPDFVPNPTPPTGYSFTVKGCVVDQADGTAAMITAPVDVEVQMPAVTLRNTDFSASFKQDADGTLRGSGSISADDVLLGKFSSGKAEGTVTARTIPADKVPAGLPQPPMK